MSETGVSGAAIGSAGSKTEDRLVRPTLYIGLGGTGAAILTALRRRIMQTMWNGHRLESLEDFKVASFLYFDTYAGPAKDQEARRKENESDDPLAPLVALPKADCIQAGLDPAKYLKQDPQLGTAELNNYPYVKAWLPAEELSTINLEEGAGQIRSMSRLLFFDRVSDSINPQIAARLRQLRNNLQEKALLKDQGLITTDRVNVKIIGSAAGGTGSGSFLDMGYLAKAMRDPRPDEVSLWLVLGGAFAGQGTRVMANSYAALAELEYAMKLRYSDPDFVESWDGRLKPLDKRPFDRLFLFDSTNTHGVGVNKDGRDYVFRMIADLLLQDLAEPDLVGARRGDQSNQDTKYREPMYVPTVTRSYAGQGLEYSRLYSSLGQSTVETQARIEYQAEGAEVAIRMLKAYFRIEETDSEPPKPAAVESYLTETLALGPSRQFVVHKDIRNPPVLSDYPLIFSKLLLAADGSSLLQSVQNDVNGDFQRLIENPNLKDWPTLAQDILTRRRSEIQQDTVERDRVNLTIRTAAVENACRQLVAQLTGPEGLIRRTLLDLVDSDVGGIAYTYAFIDALKARISAYWKPLFTRDADTYAQLAEKVISQLYQQAEQNLTSESKGGLMSGPNRQRMLTIVHQMQDTLTVWMQYRLRQIACKKAVELLNAVYANLGEQTGAGADGKPAYTGVLREISEGEDTVRATIKALETEAAVIRDPDSAKNPIHQVVASEMEKGRSIVVIEPAAYRVIANVAFKEYGGATRIFASLRNTRQQAEVISRLRRVASEEVGPSGRPVLTPESEVPSLMSDLARLPRARQETIIRDAVKQAMPWVNIDKGRIGDAWREDMRSIFVCVRDSQSFKAQFGGLVARAVADCGDAEKEINYVETVTQGRLLICTELSGLPLDALIQMHHDWLRSYDQVREDPQQAPLHTHMMWEKFGRPTAPDAAQMRGRLDDIALFIQGVAFGDLRRRIGNNVPPGRLGQYEINLAAGLTKSNWVPIGRELKIRNFGLKSEHRLELQRELQALVADMNPPQLMASLALFEFYSQHHYSPRLVEDTERAGMGHLAADMLVDEFMKRYKETSEGRKADGVPNAIKKQAQALIAAIDEWTEEISGSLDDVDGREANKEDPDRMARPKRVIRKDVFENEEALRRLMAGKDTSAAAPARPAAPVADRQFWYVGADGKPAPRAVNLDALADLVAKGEVGLDTKLCEKGTKVWRAAREWPDLAELFELPPPLENEDGPPPMN